MRLPIQRKNAMKKQNKHPNADFSQFPNFKTKQSPLINDSFQAALHENMPTIQEMKTVIFLAELVKKLEKSS